jgi:Cytochrome bd terminal oxidase subunit I
MIFDAVFLSRLQFAWVVGWHVILPAFMIGIASYIAVLEGLRLSTGRDVYLRAARIWEWRTLGGSRDAAPFAVGIVLFLLSLGSIIKQAAMDHPYGVVVLAEGLIEALDSEDLKGEEVARWCV